MKILYNLLKYILAFISFLIFIFCLKVFFDIDFFEEFEKLTNPKTENNIVDSFVNKKIKSEKINPPYKYGFSKNEYELVKLEFAEQFEYIEKNITNLRYKYLFWFNVINEDKTLGTFNIVNFYETYGNLMENFNLLEENYLNNKRVDQDILKTIEKDSRYIFQFSFSFKNIIEKYNFYETHCHEMRFKDKIFFKKIPFSKENKKEFFNIYNNNIVPYYNEYCADENDYMKVSKYIDDVKLFEPDYEYNQILKKISEIHDYVFINMIAKDSVISKMINIKNLSE